MKPLRFLGISLLVAAGLSLLTSLVAVVIDVWTPVYLDYGVISPMHVFWARLVVTGFVAMAGFAIPACLLMAATAEDDQ